MAQKILEGINAIIFDLGGVILNLDYTLTIDAFKELGGKDFEKQYSQASQQNMFDALETGNMSSEDFVSKLLSYLPNDVSANEVIMAWNKMLLDLPVKRLELIKDLSHSYQLFLYSNTNAIHFEAFTSDLEQKFGKSTLVEDYFIKCYYSHVLGKRKPNADGFQHILNENNLDASSTLFIDDSIQHIEGAKLLGINTYHLQGEDIIDIFDEATLH